MTKSMSQIFEIWFNKKNVGQNVELKKNQKWEKADQLSCLICREQHKGTWDNVALLFTEFTFFTPLEGGSSHFYPEESSGIEFLAMVSVSSYIERFAAVIN